MNIKFSNLLCVSTVALACIDFCCAIFDKEMQKNAKNYVDSQKNIFLFNKGALENYYELERSFTIDKNRLKGDKATYKQFEESENDKTVKKWEAGEVGTFNTLGNLINIHPALKNCDILVQKEEDGSPKLKNGASDPLENTRKILEENILNVIFTNCSNDPVKVFQAYAFSSFKDKKSLEMALSDLPEYAQNYKAGLKEAFKDNTKKIEILNGYYTLYCLSEIAKYIKGVRSIVSYMTSDAFKKITEEIKDSDLDENQKYYLDFWKDISNAIKSSEGIEIDQKSAEMAIFSTAKSVLESLKKLDNAINLHENYSNFNEILKIFSNYTSIFEKNSSKISLQWVRNKWNDFSATFKEFTKTNASQMGSGFDESKGLGIKHGMVGTDDKVGISLSGENIDVTHDAWCYINKYKLVDFVWDNWENLSVGGNSALEKTHSVFTRLLQKYSGSQNIQSNKRTKENLIEDGFKLLEKCNDLSNRQNDIDIIEARNKAEEKSETIKNLKPLANKFEEISNSATSKKEVVTRYNTYTLGDLEGQLLSTINYILRANYGAKGDVLKLEDDSIKSLAFLDTSPIKRVHEKCSLQCKSGVWSIDGEIEKFLKIFFDKYIFIGKKLKLSDDDKKSKYLYRFNTNNNNIYYPLSGLRERIKEEDIYLNSFGIFYTLACIAEELYEEIKSKLNEEVGRIANDVEKDYNIFNLPTRVTADSSITFINNYPQINNANLIDYSYPALFWPHEEDDIEAIKEKLANDFKKIYIFALKKAYEFGGFNNGIEVEKLASVNKLDFLELLNSNKISTLNVSINEKQALQKTVNPMENAVGILKYKDVNALLEGTNTSLSELQKIFNNLNNNYINNLNNPEFRKLVGNYSISLIKVLNNIENLRNEYNRSEYYKEFGNLPFNDLYNNILEIENETFLDFTQTYNMFAGTMSSCNYFPILSWMNNPNNEKKARKSYGMMNEIYNFRHLPDRNKNVAGLLALALKGNISPYNVFNNNASVALKLSIYNAKEINNYVIFLLCRLIEKGDVTITNPEKKKIPLADSAFTILQNKLSELIYGIDVKSDISKLVENEMKRLGNNLYYNLCNNKSCDINDIGNAIRDSIEGLNSGLQNLDIIIEEEYIRNRQIKSKEDRDVFINTISDIVVNEIIRNYCNDFDMLWFDAREKSLFETNFPTDMTNKISKYFDKYFDDKWKQTQSTRYGLKLNLDAAVNETLNNISKDKELLKLLHEIFEMKVKGCKSSREFNTPKKDNVPKTSPKAKLELVFLKNLEDFLKNKIVIDIFTGKNYNSLDKVGVLEDAIFSCINHEKISIPVKKYEEGTSEKQRLKQIENSSHHDFDESHANVSITDIAEYLKNGQLSINEKNDEETVVTKGVKDILNRIRGLIANLYNNQDTLYKRDMENIKGQPKSIRGLLETHIKDFWKNHIWQDVVKAHNKEHPNDDTTITEADL